MCFNPCAFLVESAVSPTRRFVALRCVVPVRVAVDVLFYLCYNSLSRFSFFEG